VVGFVGAVDDLVGSGEFAVGPEFSVVEFQRRCLGVRIDVVARGLTLVHPGDADAAFRADDVFHEEGDLAHHRAPPRFIPADRTVFETDLELSVIVHPGDELFGKSSPDRADAERLGPRHLAHHVDVVDAAIDDGRHRVHEHAVGVPHLAGGLLVEIHPHHERLAEGLGDLDEALPGGVDAQDVADHELAIGRLCRRDDFPGLGDGDGDGFFQKDVTARREGFPRVVGVGVGVGIDRDGIGLRLGEGVLVVGKLRILGPEGVEEIAARGFAAGDDAYDFKAGHGMVGLGVGFAHVAAADDENFDGR